MKNLEFDRYLDLSVVLTGFSRLDLIGTGLARQYFDTITSIVGDEVCDDLWLSASKILSGKIDEKGRNELIRKKLLSSSMFGPVVRNLIKLWYLGQWEVLPSSWHEVYGSNPGDVNKIISSSSYKEGLVWIAIGAHPMGAKQPGFGTWSTPPKSRGSV